MGLQLGLQLSAGCILDGELRYWDSFWEGRKGWEEVAGSGLWEGSKLRRRQEQGDPVAAECSSYVVAARCSDGLLLEGTRLGPPRQPRLALHVLRLFLQLSSPLHSSCSFFQFESIYVEQPLRGKG